MVFDRNHVRSFRFALLLESIQSNGLKISNTLFKSFIKACILNSFSRSVRSFARSYVDCLARELCRNKTFSRNNQHLSTVQCHGYIGYVEDLELPFMLSLVAMY